MHATLRWAVAVAVLVMAMPAFSSSYPVSGRWTYDYSAEKGPAKQCGPRHMEFSGERRFDTGGSVPDFRNMSIESDGADYRIIDEMFTGQIRGHVDYRLHVIDSDHIALTFASGTRIQLRRCP
jgi:hypothetical protein